MTKIAIGDIHGMYVSRSRQRVLKEYMMATWSIIMVFGDDEKVVERTKAT